MRSVHVAELLTQEQMQYGTTHLRKSPFMIRERRHFLPAIDIDRDPVSCNDFPTLPLRAYSIYFEPSVIAPDSFPRLLASGSSAGGHVTSRLI